MLEPSRLDRAAVSKIGEVDLTIAAHPLAVGAVLVTKDVRHFERIDAPLRLANWA